VAGHCEKGKEGNDAGHERRRARSLGHSELMHGLKGRGVRDQPVSAQRLARDVAHDRSV